MGPPLRWRRRHAWPAGSGRSSPPWSRLPRGPRARPGRRAAPGLAPPRERAATRSSSRARRASRPRSRTRRRPSCSRRSSRSLRAAASSSAAPARTPPPRRSSSRRRRRTPAPTGSWSSPRTTTSRRSAGLIAHFERVADATDLPIDRLQHPRPDRHAHRARHAAAARQGPEHRRGEGLDRRLPGDVAAHRRGAARLRGLLRRRLGDVRLRVPGRGRGRVAWRATWSGPQIRQMIDLIETGDIPAARKIHETLTPAVQRAVHHEQPDPGEDRARDGRPAGRPAAPAARAGHRRGARRGSARRWRMPVSSDTDVRVVFLGGVGEVGRNMACVELDGRILIVDVGPVVPVRGHAGDRPGAPGLRLRPRTGRRRRGGRAHPRARGPHRRARRTCSASSTDVPVYGTAFTLALLEGKLEEHGVADRCDLHVVDAGRGDDHGRAVLDAVPARHALDPRRHGRRDRHAVRRRSCTPGDFKIDQTPLDGRPTDLHGLAEEASGAGRPPAAVRLHQRRGGRLHRERAERRAGAAPDHREGAADRRRRVLLEPHPPDPAGRERGSRERARRRVPRPLDAQERGGRPAARAPPRSRRGHRRHRGGRPRSIPAGSS